MTARDQVPVVDISPFFEAGLGERRRVAAAFGRAFEKSGFVALIGHRVPESLVESAYAAAEDFFALPLDEKMHYALPERRMNRGYLPSGIETVAQTLGTQTPPDLCEALVFRSLFQEERSIHDEPNGWRNQWPSRPEQLAACVREYYWRVDELSATIYRLAAVALDLPEDYFAPYFREHATTLRFVNYPDQAKEPLPGQLRYGAHHDYGGLTIVRQDAAPGGLQVCATDGGWHDVPIVPQSFIVNVGDLMSHWTNGRWRSTLHRVINPSRALTGSTKRLSLVLFSRPDDDAEIVCLPTCVGADTPARFTPVTAGAFTRAKMERSATVST